MADDIDGVPLGEEEISDSICSPELNSVDTTDGQRHDKCSYRDERWGSRDRNKRRRDSRDRRYGRSRSRRSRSRERSRSPKRRSSRRHGRSRSRSRSRSSSSSNHSYSRRSERENRDRKERKYDDDHYYDYDRSRPQNTSFESVFETENYQYQPSFGNEWDQTGTNRMGYKEGMSNAGYTEDDGSRPVRIKGQHWKDKLTSIREAHFNRSKQAPTPNQSQNQFKNDGSFLEMFKQKMAQQGEGGEDKSLVTPNSLLLASSSIPFSPGLSLPPLTPAATEDVQVRGSTSVDLNEDVDGTPMAVKKTLPVPVSVGKRRLAKPLKTGIVFKKPQKEEETNGSQEQLDAWSSYLKEVQKYKTAKCMDDDVSRPLVK